MRPFKKVLVLIMIIVMVNTLLVGCVQKVMNIDSRLVEGRSVKVGVLQYKASDLYISEVRQNLEQIQNENEGKVQFTFFDANGNQTIQNENLDEAFKEGADLLLVNLVDTRAAQAVINKVKEKNIPVILFNREPNTTDALKSYSKDCYIGTEAEEAGPLQGKIIVNAWNTKKNVIDRNGDNVMQYIMLQGERDSIQSIQRTEYCILAIKDAGIQMEELALRVCNWDQEQARSDIETLLLRYGGHIEVIISNNDAMAIGAIEALQAHGYNKGNNSPTVAVFGIDGTLAAQDLIKDGFMMGTVGENRRELAEALYTCGMNLVNGKSPIEGTKYKFDRTGISIRIPYKEYVSK
jgi:methyl-galactoside transport system substrate-binding protein